MVLLNSENMSDPIIFTAQSEGEFYGTAFEDLTLSIKEVLQSKTQCVIGLAGGRTPRKLYELLAGENLPWNKIIFLLIDERYVPSDHPDSNLKMIRSTLLNHIPMPPENLIAFDTSLPPDSGAKEMSRKLSSLNRDPLIDILILGVGEDGHIASLFDNEIAALQSNHYADVATKRLTLTLKSLLGSGKTFILLKGKNKEGIFEEIKTGVTGHIALGKILENGFLKIFFCP